MAQGSESLKLFGGAIEIPLTTEGWFQFDAAKPGQKDYGLLNDLFSGIGSGKSGSELLEDARNTLQNGLSDFGSGVAEDVGGAVGGIGAQVGEGIKAALASLGPVLIRVAFVLLALILIAMAFAMLTGNKQIVMQTAAA